MGVTLDDVRFLVEARAAGVDFARTLTIGRQQFYLSPDDLDEASRLFPDPAAARAVLAGEAGSTTGGGGPVTYADGLFALLGAAQVDSLDLSDFEGATLLHDLNQPVPPQLHGRYDLVYDGGSLEHVFAFPTAIRSCMEMVKVDGHLLVQSPTNNWCGHGFYQFSPELYFRVLAPENGFVVEQMVAVELDGRGRWFSVKDPARVGRRVELRNHTPTNLMVRARRVDGVTPFASTPQQSDYARAWDRSPAPAPPPAPTATAPLTRLVRAGGRVRGEVRAWLAGQGRSRPLTLSDRRFYTPVGGGPRRRPRARRR